MASNLLGTLFNGKRKRQINYRIGFVHFHHSRVYLCVVYEIKIKYQSSFLFDFFALLHPNRS